MKTLVAYFSATGTTKEIAEKVAKVANADLFEIQPKQPYTAHDLDWTDKNSRSTIEMQNKNSRPEIQDNSLNLDDYSTILLGFPVWWYTAPTIIKTFLEAHNFSNKKIVLFGTSGGSGLGGAVQDLAPCVDASTQILNGKVLRTGSNAEILDMLNSIK